jgi:hypothetical protein
VELLEIFPAFLGNCKFITAITTALLVPITISTEECVYSPAGAVSLPSHLTYCTPTKSNLYLDSSLETVIRKPALYKRLMFHVLNIMSIPFRSFIQRICPSPWLFCDFVTNLV